MAATWPDALPDAPPTLRPYQTQRQLTREEVGQMVARHEAGASMQQIADELGVHRTTILKRLQGLGITTRYSKLTREQVCEAAALYADGWTLDRIAKRYHVATSTVREYLLADGVELRPRGRRAG
ncbi:helix-turn-helix domain-containing protein [Amycolatopsis mediterranei]